VVALMATGCPTPPGDVDGGSTGDGGSKADSSTTADSGGPGGDATTSDGPTGDGGLSLTPSSGNALTCSQVIYQVFGPGAPTGTWALAPTTGAGTVSGGVYTAPTSVPVGPDAGTTVATVTYSGTGGMATSVLDVGTAFLGPAAIVPIPGINNFSLRTYPLDHRFTANGNQVYAAFIDPGGLAVNVYSSTDYGQTFVKTVSYSGGQGPLGGNSGSATVAVDPGNPAVVYLLYSAALANNNGNGLTTRLAVSTDGAKSFLSEYVLLESSSVIGGYVTPDLVSPSTGHVIVSATNGPPTIFASDMQGANIGPPSVDGGVGPGMTTNKNGAPVICNKIDGINGEGNTAARLFSNGQGSACVVYRVDPPPCSGGMVGVPGGVTVQCSPDSGVTWSSPTVVTQPALFPVADDLVTGAMSPSGKIAVTWMDATTLGATGGATEVWVATSTVAAQMAGQAFTTSLYPPANRAAAGGAGATTSLPVVQWQNDTVLWLAQTVVGNSTLTLVDKTCDNGASWSGWVSAGPYTGSSLFLTVNNGQIGQAGKSTGMVLGGSSTTPSQIVDVPLAYDEAVNSTP
jgi:hypothetical protein